MSRPRTNQQIFGKFAAPIHGDVKTGQRIVHIPSGVAGVVLCTRAGQVCWRPDTRIKRGGVWVDADKIRVEV